MKKTILRTAAAMLMLCIVACGVGCGSGIEQPEWLKQAICEHDFNEKVIIKEPTCTESGSAQKFCSKCGMEKTIIQKALGHTEIVDEEIAATCTQPGLTAGSHCSVCGVVMVKQEEVTVDHTYGAWMVDVAATCETEGQQKRVCTVCGETETEVIPACGGPVDVDNDNQCDVCDTWLTYMMTEVAVETGELVAGNWYRMYYTSSYRSIQIDDSRTTTFIAYSREPGYESNYIFMSGPLYTLEGFEAVFGDGYIDIHMVAGAYNLMKEGVVVTEEGSVIIDSTTKITYFEEGTVFRLV